MLRSALGADVNREGMEAGPSRGKKNMISATGLVLGGRPDSRLGKLLWRKSFSEKNSAHSMSLDLLAAGLSS